MNFKTKLSGRIQMDNIHEITYLTQGNDELLGCQLARKRRLILPILYRQPLANPSLLTPATNVARNNVSKAMKSGKFASDQK